MEKHGYSGEDTPKMLKDKKMERSLRKFALQLNFGKQIESTIYKPE